MSILSHMTRLPSGKKSNLAAWQQSNGILLAHKGEQVFLTEEELLHIVNDMMWRSKEFTKKLNKLKGKNV